jgi:hypothetical protein
MKAIITSVLYWTTVGSAAVLQQREQAPPSPPSWLETQMKQSFEVMQKLAPNIKPSATFSTESKLRKNGKGKVIRFGPNIVPAGKVCRSAYKPSFHV